LQINRRHRRLHYLVIFGLASCSALPHAPIRLRNNITRQMTMFNMIQQFSHPCSVVDIVAAELGPRC
jgi:hypothetical protein